jgi:hypothetical protein
MVFSLITSNQLADGNWLTMIVDDLPCLPSMTSRTQPPKKQKSLT